MIIEKITNKIVDLYPYAPTDEQMNLMEQLSFFVVNPNSKKLFVLKGYAGTGKTTVVATLVKALRQMKLKTVLMAPTGRAAKVFSQYSGYTAYTIHKKIYRQKSITDNTSFQLNRNSYEDTLFIVDESSMISNQGLSGNIFGTGRLLDDLITFVYSSKGCSLLLLGDTAQLPPVGESESPALIEKELASYGLDINSFLLKTVMRQTYSSGILYNATVIRNMLPERVELPVEILSGYKFKISGFSDVVRIGGQDLIETISNCYSKDGIDETIVLCRSNKRAIIYNNGIRNTILDREDELNKGEHLMIVKNNYYWTEHLAPEDRDSYLEYPSFIANGDVAVVQRIRRSTELYGFRYVNVTLTFPDYDDIEMDVTLMLDTLHSESPSLTAQENEQLFSNVMEDYIHIRSKKERMKQMRENMYYNAIQVKYAYAITCHKAQGGQWKNVFIDQGFVPDGGRNADYARWLYTALTRATETVYLVNWPEKEIE